jgi:adenylate kinase family enzyme
VAAGGEIERVCSAERILVVGPSGSGKTQLALRLGELLGIPLVHLDAHRWRPGWVALPDRDWRPVVAELTRAPMWIMDGTYESTLDLRIPAADAVIVVEVRRLYCLLGLFRRRFLDGKRLRPDAPAGQRIDRASLRYLWRYPVATRPLLLAQLREHGGGKTVIVLHGRRQVRRLVQDVRRLKSYPGVNSYAGLGSARTRE